MDDLSKRIATLSPAKRALLNLRLKVESAGSPVPLTTAPGGKRESAAVSFAQQRLWFLNQLEPEGASYNVPRVIRMVGTLNLKALEQSLNGIVARHESLRTHFFLIDDTLTQVIAGESTVQLSIIDLSELTPADRHRRSREIARQEATDPFDLSRGPVVRARLVQLSPTEHLLLLTMHHIVSDAWSAGILFRELGELYKAFATGKPSPLAPLKIQYADFAEWQRDWLQGAVLEEQLGYWRKQLADAPVILNLPTDRPRPANTLGGACRSSTIPQSLTEQLKELSRQEGVTLFMTLLATFSILLSRYSGQDDIVVGTPIAGRNRAEIEELIGFFINTLALRINLAGNPTFRTLLARAKETALGGYAHQDLPFEKLVEELQPERSLGRNPFFQVMFQLQNTPSSSLELSGLTLTTETVERNTAKFELSLGAYEWDGGLTLPLEYSTDLFDGETVELMLQRFCTLLQSIVSNPDCRIGNLELMSENERGLLVAWNKTEAEFAGNDCLQGMFARQAEKTPNRVAVSYGNEQLSYAELNARANQVAHYLRKRGVGPEVAVGICVERSPEMIVGLLGILKAGGAYVPIDPTYPSERVLYLLEDSKAALLLTQKRIAESLPKPECLVVLLDADWQEIGAESEANPQASVSSDNAAYIIYTSGSTGKPKGVMGTHRAALNRFTWMWRAYPFADGEICSQKTSLGFVDSIWEIFGPLLHGVPIVIIADDEVKDPRRLIACLSEQEVTRIVLVPSLLRAILEDGDELERRLAGLKYWVCSGEALTAELAESFQRKLPQSLLINLYGSSEVAADVTCHEVSRAEEGNSIPLGRPIANTQIYVLDKNLEPVPVGIAGEIHVGGEGLARGYLARPELTAEKFIANPFSFAPGSRLYRTGDIGRFLADGNIEFIGRRDHQVKIRGSRIELGEIEAALVDHPQIRDSIVLLRDDFSGDKRLSAYLLCNGKAPANGELRAYLKQKLPDYMLPSAFIVLDKFPLTASGKVNRLALPLPDRYHNNERDYLAPRTITEEIIVEIVAEVLGVEEVSVNDDFFELGGHSLLLTRVASRLSDVFHIEVPIRVLFENSRVSRLAEEVENMRVVGQSVSNVPLLPVSRDRDLPLSFAQESLWVFDQIEPNTGAYNIPRALRLKGKLAARVLEQSLEKIVARHETLRTTFTSENGKPVQKISDLHSVTIPVVDLSDLPEVEREERVRLMVVQESQRPFNLATGPLVRICLLRLSEEEHILIVTMHHIISDGWSMRVFFEELVSLYNSLTVGSEETLHEPALQYADYAAWQRQTFSEADLEPSFAYWRKQLADAPAIINLPTDRLRPKVRSFRGARHPFEISEGNTESIKKLARRERVTLFMTLLASLQSLLWWYSKEEDIVVGCPSAGRRSDTERLIGYFVKTLVLRTRLSADPEFREVMHRIREVTVGALTHQHVPFEKLVQEFQPVRTLSHNPLFQVWFVLHNGEAERRDFQDLTAESFEIPNEFTRHDLQLTLWETAHRLKGAFTYSTDLFDARTIAHMNEQFNVLLLAVVEQPDIRLSGLRIVLDQHHQAYRKGIERKLQETASEKLRSVRRRSVSEIDY